MSTNNTTHIRFNVEIRCNYPSQVPKHYAIFNPYTISDLSMLHAQLGNLMMIFSYMID